MSKFGIIQRNSSRGKPRETSNLTNMKNSAPAYSASIQKPANNREKSNYMGSDQSSSKNTFTYDYGNTALKSLLRDKNIPDPTLNQNR